ncbi:MAG: histidinol-phosphatase HisJ family protein, partial [Planctomycetota bacterium]
MAQPWDQHLHSRHSFDSRAEPEANVRVALERGLKGLTFTEHFDTNPRDWDGCVYDDEAYSADIDRLREAFGASIFIGKGIEVCYQPSRMDDILRFLSAHRFDLVMLSVHYFGDVPVHDRAQWKDIDVTAGTRRYLETVLDAVRMCGRLRRRGERVFHVLGHLDLVKRYTHRFFGTNAVEAFGDLIDEILAGCLEADLVPEINTSTLRQGLDEPMPGLDTLRRYARLGGEAVGLGSDAHRAEDIGADFDRAVALARKAGLTKLALFRDGERAFVPLP